MSAQIKNILRKILFMLLFPSLVYAQNSTIKGKVVDTLDRANLSFATVALMSVSDSSVVRTDITDSLGNFQLSKLSRGNYMLWISSLEYKKFKMNITVGDSVVNAGIITLSRTGNILNNVTIKGVRQTFVRKSDRITINVEGSDFFKTATNVTDVLKRAPGVRVSNEGNIILRNNTAAVVLINGKVTAMNPEQLNSYLSSLNKNDIESIDLIETPSAKYDSEYKAVVDIKLKKSKSEGLSGTLSSYGQVDKFGRYGGSLSSTYRTKNFAYNVGYNYNHIKTSYENDIKQLLDNGTHEIRSQIENAGVTNSNNYQFGVDYFVAKNQTIGVSMKGYQANTVNPFRTYTTDNLVPSMAENSAPINTTNYQTSRPDNYSFSGSYRGQFKTGTLNFDAYYANYKSHQKQDITNMIIDLDDERQRTDNTGHIINKVMELEYAFNLGSGKLDIGSKLSKTSNNSAQRNDTLNMGQWQVNEKFSDQFLYDETIVAGYASYSVNLNKAIDLQVGMRVENTDTKGNSLTNNEISSNEYLSYLPNLNIGFLLDGKDKITVSYSKRLQRPPFFSLNPFRLYINPYSYSEGNPFLLPSKIDLGIISYSHNNLSFSLSAKHRDDILLQVPFLDPETNITGYKQTNLGKDLSTTLDADYSLTLTSWWKMQNYVALVYKTQKFMYGDQFYKRNNLSFSFNGTQSFTLPKEYIVNLSYAYDGKANELIYTLSPSYAIDLGIQKSLFNKRLDAKLSFTDIFYTANAPMTINVGNYNSRIFQKYNTRGGKIQFTYNFGKTASGNRAKNIHAEEDSRSK